METRIRVLAKSQNRIALGVMRAYVILHPEATLSDIAATFPRRINPDSGVKENFIDANMIPDVQGENWNGFFSKQQELIALSDGTELAITSMWTKASLDRLLARVADFGIEAQKVASLPEQVDELPGQSEHVPSKSVGYVIEYVNGSNPAPVPAQSDPVPAQSDPVPAQSEPAPTNLVDTVIEHVNGLNAATATKSALMLEVERDIIRFLQHMESNPSAEKKNIFFNENDFQMHLSIYLTQLRDEQSGKPKYDDVDIEYFIPIADMKKGGYVWDNKAGVNIDIVVEKADEFVPIELKYTTDAVNFEVKRFGEVLGNYDIIKHQGATNLVMYNYWKDVKRIEVLKNRFPAVKNGLAVMLTNDVAYLQQPREGSACVAFSMAQGKHSQQKYWQGDPAVKAQKPDFDVSQQYEIEWRNIKLDGVDYHYTIIEV